MKPVYEAAARVEVDKEAQSMQPFPDSNGYGEYEDTEAYIETQTKILQSETLALMTIKSLDLARYPEFGGSPIPSPGSMLVRLLAGPPYWALS